jgi:uncharacterized protein (DUF433 family)
VGLSQSLILDNYPTLTATDLANAWAYAAAFLDEIEIAIRENDEAEEILDPPENIN